MFNFFHNLGLGIVSAFMAFTGAFHSQPPAIIQDTQPEIGSTTTQNISASTSVQSTSATSTQITKKRRVEVVKSTDNSTVIQSEVQAQVQTVLKAKADADAQALVKQEADQQAQIDAANKKAQDAEAYAILHRNDAEIKAEQDRQNSPDCISAKNAYNTIHQQFMDANSTYNQQYSAILNRGGGTAESKANEISALQQQNGYNLTDMALKDQSAFNAKNNACEVWQPSPTPTINTNCTVTGSVANCFSQ